jgi:16S rRNA processing protein RimM
MDVPHPSSLDDPSGSEEEFHRASEPDFLIVGRIIRPHGVRGDVSMMIITDYPERLLDTEILYVGPTHRPHRVVGARRHRDAILLRFEGVPDRDGAEAFRNQFVYIRRCDAVPLEEGEFYFHQLENIRVVTDEGEELGRLVNFIETGANDVYIVHGPRGELLLPAIPEVILHVDVTAHIMTVHLIEGLIGDKNE